MSNGINLTKRVEQVGIILAKRNVLAVPPIRVGAAFDVSGSAKWMYEKGGVMQMTFDRLLALALKFDDNGELDTWVFASETASAGTASAADVGTFITEHIVKGSSSVQRTLWGGTSYAPAVQAMSSFFFPEASGPIATAKGMFGGLFSKKPDPTPSSPAGKTIPAMGLLITDGSNGDRGATDAILKDSANKNVYWQMIGVGDAHHFGFIEEMADKYDHVGYVNLASLDISDEALYEQLLAEEFCTWISTR